MIKVAILLLSFFSSISWHLTSTTRYNELSALGSKSYQEKNYPKALQCFHDMAYKHKSKDEIVWLNLANCYYLLGNIEISKKKYQALLLVENKLVVSQAYTQLANIEALNGKKQRALNLLRRALITNENNRIAAYNYELLYQMQANKKNKDPKRKTNVSNKDNGSNDAEMEQDSESDYIDEESDEAENKEKEKKKNQEIDQIYHTNTLKIHHQDMDRALVLLEALKQQEKNYIPERYFKNKKKKTYLNDW
jgi:tetratricopeptide (TPR) repeat protein